RGVLASWSGSAWTIVGGPTWLTGAAPSPPALALHAGGAPVVAWTGGRALRVARLHRPPRPRLRLPPPTAPPRRAVHPADPAGPHPRHRLLHAHGAGPSRPARGPRAVRHRRPAVDRRREEAPLDRAARRRLDDDVLDGRVGRAGRRVHRQGVRPRDDDRRS